MIAMAVVNHKGGGGGSVGVRGKGSTEEEDDLLTTLRRLRQTLQECHGRVGIMDQKVDALQPKLQRRGVETQNISAEKSILTHSIQVGGKQHSPEINVKQMTNGLVNGVHEENDLQNPEDLDCDDVFESSDFGRGGKVNSPCQNSLQSMLETYICNTDVLNTFDDKVDLLHLAEKHANELYNMYHSKSSAMKLVKNGHRLESEKKRTLSSNHEVDVTESIKRQNSDDHNEKDFPVMIASENLVNGDVGKDTPPLMNGSREVDVPEKPKCRKFARKKDWWHDKQKEINAKRQEVNGTGNPANEERISNSRQKMIADLIMDGTLENKFENTIVCLEKKNSQKTFESKEFGVSKLVSSDEIKLNGVARSKSTGRVFVRSEHFDLEDIPENCEIPSPVQAKNPLDEREGEGVSCTVNRFSSEQLSNTEEKQSKGGKKDPNTQAVSKCEATEVTTANNSVKISNVLVCTDDQKMVTVNKYVDDIRQENLAVISEDSKESPSVFSDASETRDKNLQINPDKVRGFLENETILCSQQDSRTCRCEKSQRNKITDDGITHTYKLHLLKEESHVDYKANMLRVKRKRNILDRLKRYRGSEKLLLVTEREALVGQKICSDKRMSSYTFIIFLLIFAILLFVFYLLLTVPIVTLSVKHNGRAVAF